MNNIEETEKTETEIGFLLRIYDNIQGLENELRFLVRKDDFESIYRYKDLIKEKKEMLKNREINVFKLINEINVINVKTVNLGGGDENDLQNKFIDALRENFKDKSVTLDELYFFYNNFIDREKVLINNISKRNLSISKNHLKLIFPKRKKKNLLDNTKVANGNKLRQVESSNEIFIEVKRKNSDELITFNITIPKVVGSSKLFDEDEDTLKEQIKIVKARDNYNKYKKIDSESIKNDAIFFETPYPVFNHVYDSELGLKKIK